MYGAVEIDTQTVIITADADELDTFANYLDAAVPHTITLEPAPSDAATRRLLTLSLELSAKDVAVVSTRDDRATIRGTSGAFSRLADEVRVFLEYNDLSVPGMHTHFEPGGRSTLGDWIVVSDDSDPLVVTGPVFDESKGSADDRAA
jgi:hypothetical protein